MSTSNYGNTSKLYNDLPSWQIGNEIFSRLDASTSRNVFTTAFLVMNILIAIVGEIFLKRRNQRRLILRRGREAKAVPFPLLTPWLGLPSLATYFYKARTLPGGLLGLMMLATGIFGQVQHYMVNSFILPAQVPNWCDFKFGIVSTVNTQEVTPSPAWPAALLVFGAHSAVLANGGAIGVYDKVNFTITSFQPTFEDVLGTWNCTEQANSAIQPSDWASDRALRSFLTAQKFLDPVSQSHGASFSIKTGAVQGFLAWSGNFDGNDSSTWEVSTTIATSLKGNATLAANNFRCNLVIQRQGWRPTPMPANDTLIGWKDIMFGFVSQIPVSHYSSQVETILNAMSILAGGGNQNNLLLPDGATAQFGCATKGSRIHITVYLIFVFLFFILIVLLVADVYQLVRYCCNGRRKIAAEIPTDLLSWQMNMVRTMTKRKELKTSDLKNWSYVLNEETNDFEFKETKFLPKRSKKNRGMSLEDSEASAGSKYNGPYQAPPEDYSTQDIRMHAPRSSQTLLQDVEYIQHDTSESKQSRR